MIEADGATAAVDTDPRSVGYVARANATQKARSIIVMAHMRADNDAH
jgi:ABC-type phosphate transport system substrate-binding protein